MTTIYHAVEMHHWPAGVDAGRRRRAQESWPETLYAQGVVPVHYREYNRDATIIGDARKLPFLLDVIEPALNQCKDGNDIVLFSNDDIVFHKDFVRAVRQHIAIWDVCTAHRCECDHRFDLNLTPDEWLAQSRPHIGRDVFAAKASWLHSMWGHLPDACLGSPFWDLHLAAIVRRSKGFILTRQNLETVFPGCELQKGYVYHEAHENQWGKLPANSPAHQHNAMLFKEWSAIHLPGLQFNPQTGQI